MSINYSEKKIARVILSAALCLPMLSGLAIAGNAKNKDAEVRWGTAVVDGKLDSAYIRSASVPMTTPFFCPWDDHPEAEQDMPLKGAADVEATAYFLWSEDYFFTCTVVKDDDVFKKDPSYYTTPYPWKDDGADGWYSYNRKSFGLHVDAYGVVMYASAGTSNGGIDAFADVPAIGADFGKPSLSNINCKTKKATTITSDGFIVETAMKLKDDAQFKAGDVMKYALQVNDMADAEGLRGYAIGSQDCFNSGTNLTFAEKTDEDVAACTAASPEAETPSSDNPQAESFAGGTVQTPVAGTSDQTGTNSSNAASGTVKNSVINPGTSDAGIYLAVAVVTSAVSFILLPKKKK